MTQPRTLSAVDVVYPGKGQCVQVCSGQVLVFAQAADGRRLPLVTVDAGGTLAGCEPAGGVRLLVVGAAQADVRELSVEQAQPEALLDWVGLLGAAVSDGRWPAKLLDVDEAGQMVAPGEHIAGPDNQQTAWVRLVGGEATWCGNRDAPLTRNGPAFALPPGTWLTAGLRARVVSAPPPQEPGEWAASLDEMGRLAMLVALQRRREHDEQIVARIEAREVSSAAASQEAVDTLVAAAGGVTRIPGLSDRARGDELAVAVFVAQASGLTVDEQGVQRAADEVQGGRDPVAAVAAAGVARPNLVTLREQWWQQEGAPMVVRVSEPGRSGNRAAAVVWQGRWQLIDPISGESRIVDAEVAALLDRKAYEILRVLPPQRLTLRSLSRLAFRGTRRELLVIAGLTGMLAAMAFITPYLLGQMANVFLSRRPDAAFAALFGALLLVVVAGGCFQAVRALSMLRARSKAAAVSATAVWERILRQKATWHSRFSLGRRMNQASAVNNASTAMPDETVAQVLDVSFVLGSLAAIATTGPGMLVALTLLLAVQAVVTLVILRFATRRAQDRFAAMAKANTVLLEIFGAVNRLRVAGAESRAYLRWAQLQGPFIKTDQALRRLTMAQGVLVAAWPMLALVVVVAVSAASGATFGEFVTAQTAAAAATAAVSAMTGAATAGVLARQSLRELNPVLDSVPEGGLEGIAPGALSGAIQARDLVFRYAPDLPPVLDHVSLSVRPGEHVAIVGPSGCGKTTLMRVLLGLEDPESGVITVDGRDLTSLNRPAVRRQIGSVLQSSSLLPCSIRENIDMNRGLTQDQIWEAVTAAGLLDDVRAMAMGIETIVTDGGGTISGGQRQRVLIARALAGNPRMLILDEATSALDNVTQAAVVESLAKARITLIVVAHRLSTIRDADRIIVMQAGRVVDEGTFEELAQRPGVFRELVARQSV